MDALILRTILDLSDDMFILLERDGKVRWISRQVARMRRVDAQRAAGRELTSIVPDPNLLRAVQQAVATGKSRQISIKLEPDETELAARVVPIAPSPEADVEAVVVALSELALEKQLQTMRREFVANVSHELRSPLTSILGYAETLLYDPPEDEEQRSRFLVAVVREAQRMQRLVEDLLNLSRIESGRASPQFTAANLHNIAGRVLTQLRGQAERAGVNLSNDVPPDLRLECDPGQIEQVVYNLVSNGVQYTPAGGSVTVSAWVEGAKVMLRVTDTGVGIPRADLPRIFERFYRVDKARSRATGATGLGLAIVKHIVDAHRGKVFVESEPGHGASFTIELPLTQRPVP